MVKFIDELCVVTNGILTKDKRFKIIDPLGYYVIFVEEIIEEVDDVDTDSGSQFSPLKRNKQKKKTKLRKRIVLKLTSCSVIEGCDFTKEIIVDDINLRVSGVDINDTKDIITVTLSNPNISDEKLNTVVKVSIN